MIISIITALFLLMSSYYLDFAGWIVALTASICPTLDPVHGSLLAGKPGADLSGSDPVILLRTAWDIQQFAV